MREGLWAPPNRALTAGLVLAITFVAAEALAVVTVMPVVARDLGGLWLYGWVFSAFMLGSIVGIVTAGREADRHGPAVPFLAGLVLFSAGLAVAGLAPIDADPGGRPGAAGHRRRRGARGGLRLDRPRPARPAAGPDDGGAVHRLGRAGAGRARAERRGGPPIRLALGLPRPAPAGRHRRADRAALAAPARPTGHPACWGAPAERWGPGGGRHRADPGRPDRRCGGLRAGRAPGWSGQRADRGRADPGGRGDRAARAAAAGPARDRAGPARAAGHRAHPGPAHVRVLRRRRLRDADHHRAPAPQPGAGGRRGDRLDAGLDHRRLDPGPAQRQLSGPPPGAHRAGHHPGRYRRDDHRAGPGRAGARRAGRLVAGRAGHGGGLRADHADDAA